MNKFSQGGERSIHGTLEDTDETNKRDTNE